MKQPVIINNSRFIWVIYGRQKRVAYCRHLRQIWRHLPAAGSDLAAAADTAALDEDTLAGQISPSPAWAVIEHETSWDQGRCLGRLIVAPPESAGALPMLTNDSCWWW